MSAVSRPLGGERPPAPTATGGSGLGTAPPPPRGWAGLASPHVREPPAAAGGAAGAAAGGAVAGLQRDVRRVADAVGKLQKHAADIRKEAQLLPCAPSVHASRWRVSDLSRDARVTLDDAKALLDGLRRTFSGASGASAAVEEQSMQRATRQKLSQSLVAVSKTLEEASRQYEEAIAARERRDAMAATGAAADAAAAAGGPGPGPEAAAAAAAGASGGGSAASGVELTGSAASAGGEGEEADGRQHLRQQLLAGREVETHAEVVDEYVQEVSTLNRDIQDLQRAMVDLLDHTESQGESLDNIEANFTRASEDTGGAQEQLVQANRGHRRGAKVLYCLLAVALAMAIAVSIAAACKHRKR